MMRDLRFLLRLIRSHWLSIGPTVALLACSVASTTTVYTVFNRLVLHPLALRADDLILNLGGLTFQTATRDAVAWWAQAQGLEKIAGYASGGVRIGDDGHTSNVIRGSVVSADFFGVFGITPVQGRDFALDDEKNAAHLAIVSGAFAQNYLAGHPIGANIRLNGETYSVIGVAPPQFFFPLNSQIWVIRNSGDLRWYSTVSDLSNPDIIELGAESGWIGRLRTNASPQLVERQLYGLLSQLNDLRKPSGMRAGDVIKVVTLNEAISRKLRPAMLVFTIGASAIMLIAAINLGTLMLSNISARRTEFAVRRALGASSRRIWLQIMTEAGGISVICGLLGIVLASWFVEVVHRLLPDYLVALWSTSPATHILSTSFALSALIGVACGAAPAIRASSNKWSVGLRDGPGLSGGRRETLRKAYLAVQVALTLMLTTTALLSIKVVIRASTVDLGFNPLNALSARITSAKSSGEDFLVTERSILDVASSTGLFSAIGISSASSATGPHWNLYLARGGTTFPFSTVTPHYFGALGTNVSAGREFADQEEARVAIINEKMAKQFWPDKSPVGDVLLVEGEGVPRQIVGIVATTHSADPTDDVRAQFFLPYSQPFKGYVNVGPMYLVARCKSSCSGALGPLRERLADLGGGITVDWVSPLKDTLDEAFRPAEIRARLLGTYSIISLGLVLFGTFALASYIASLRMREIGVRMALGAATSDIIRLVLREAATAVVVGLLSGTFLSLALGRGLAYSLHGVGLVDISSLVVASVMIVLGISAAFSIPGLRSARVGPSQLLREE